MQLPAHGANASTLYEAMRITMPQQVIDLSENVNALGIPAAIIQAWPKLIEKVSAYPHEQAEPFRSLVAKSHVVQSQQVLVTNGAAEGLMVLAQYFKGQNVVVLEPSFSEYKRTLQQHNCQIQSIVANDLECYKFDMNDLHNRLQNAQACYICNPNNPTGVLLDREWIEALVKRHRQCIFIVDEAFIDWTDEAQSVITLIKQYVNIIVIRSMTKMFAMAGVRLGYMLGQKVEKLRPHLPHWSVSNIAIDLGCICLEQQKFIVESRDYSANLLKKMKHYFHSIDCIYTNSAANYLLFKLPATFNTQHFFSYLLVRGIVLRHTKNYEGLHGEWFRIAVKTENMWEQAKKEIDDYVKNNSLLSP
ncbi:aminotransferase class I/II-fold pyridoxal phosphate-dependent enzyme [Solibacillus sp. MA9]|uniref:Aminotransferase class I/II-fold pyridoxal phosphate-dependent enzyme n=1 Tax=Solibacillus palustris TaxID=2908203 RepID=A0ABS9UC76_9BACL|nr:aminotransferase class I/II-fold pyridoxal phosphate-dependent enzyme [Solibacillus sp. MA9]MCH7321950.1 aminotransferase class I/II-fold pyridoxal phosphate-dependent enzyme [Solibacillus sp. MA9]